MAGRAEASIDVRVDTEKAERDLQNFSDAMDRSRGSKSEAAKALGIPRTTLINKLKRYGLFP